MTVHYESGTKSAKDIAYESALLVLGLLILLTVIIGAKYLGLPSLWPVGDGVSRGEQYIWGLSYMLPLFFLLRYFYPKQKMVERKFTETQVNIGKAVLTIYVILLIVAGIYA